MWQQSGGHGPVLDSGADVISAYRSSRLLEVIVCRAGIPSIRSCRVLFFSLCLSFDSVLPPPLLCFLRPNCLFYWQSGFACPFFYDDVCFTTLSAAWNMLKKKTVFLNEVLHRQVSFRRLFSLGCYCRIAAGPSPGLRGSNRPQAAAKSSCSMIAAPLQRGASRRRDPTGGKNAADVCDVPRCSLTDHLLLVPRSTLYGNNPH